MAYINKSDSYLKKKKMVSSRVPAIYLSALYAAETDVASCGFDSSISKIITIAFKDALSEIKEKIGVDYYELEKFKHDIMDLQSRINPTTRVNPDLLAEEIKEQSISISQQTSEDIDVMPLIAEYKARVLKDWKNEEPKRGAIRRALLGDF